jgi:hypothetical protein
VSFLHLQKPRAETRTSVHLHMHSRLWETSTENAGLSYLVNSMSTSITEAEARVHRWRIHEMIRKAREQQSLSGKTRRPPCRTAARVIQGYRYFLCEPFAPSADHAAPPPDSDAPALSPLGLRPCWCPLVKPAAAKPRAAKPPRPRPRPEPRYPPSPRDSLSIACFTSGIVSFSF